MNGVRVGFSKLSMYKVRTCRLYRTKHYMATFFFTFAIT